VRIFFLMGVAFLYHLTEASAGTHRLKPVQALSEYAQECGACHVAYPPAFLSADSWQRIMLRLSQHYGVDASLDPAQTKTIEQWLQREAGAYKKVQHSPPEDRISRSDWFVREHRRVAPEVWRLPSVQSSAQCNACHAQAEQASFSERELRTPAGMKGDFR
jgi:hypothetical protein